MDFYPRYAHSFVSAVEDWPATAFGLWFRTALIGGWIAVAGLVVLVTGEAVGTGLLMLAGGAAVGAWAWRNARRLLDHLDPPAVTSQSSKATSRPGSVTGAMVSAAR
ncbi:MAG: hypothetical protein ABI920_19795 [Casimicrobiaceae bacterium]